jgi:hypothetical protein
MTSSFVNGCLLIVEFSPVFRRPDELEEFLGNRVFCCLACFSLLLPSDGQPIPPFIDVNWGKRPKWLAALAQSFGKVGEPLDWTESPDRRSPVAIPPQTLATLSHSFAREEILFAKEVRCNLTISFAHCATTIALPATAKKEANSDRVTLRNTLQAIQSI